MPGKLSCSSPAMAGSYLFSHTSREKMRKEKLSLEEGGVMRSLLDMPGGLELHIGVGDEGGGGWSGTAAIRSLLAICTMAWCMPPSCLVRPKGRPFPLLLHPDVHPVHHVSRQPGAAGQVAASLLQPAHHRHVCTGVCAGNAGWRGGDKRWVLSQALLA